MYSIQTVIRPTIVKADTIPALKRKIRNDRLSKGRKMDDTVIGYHIEKHNKTSNRFTNGKLRKKPVIVRGYAMAYVYTFTKQQLKDMGNKRVVQTHRNFKLVDA